MRRGYRESSNFGASAPMSAAVPRSAQERKPGITDQFRGPMRYPDGPFAQPSNLYHVAQRIVFCSKERLHNMDPERLSTPCHSLRFYSQTIWVNEQR